MLSIAICDDDKTQVDHLRNMIVKILFSRCEYAITVYRDGQDIVGAMNKGAFRHDLLLLDINMHQTNGLAVADLIRKNEIDIDIIFITVSREHVYDGYLYKAFSYILKPVFEDKLRTELFRYLDEKEKIEGHLNVTIRGTLKRIPLNKILFFESNARKIMVYAEQEEVEFYGKLDDIQSSLDSKYFFRCHQSYLINLRKLSSVSRSSAMVEGRTIPVSRKYYDLLIDRMNDKRRD